MIDYEFLRFERENVEGRKTPIVHVMSKRQNVELGQIKWYGGWRQYALFPAYGTIWNPDCLNAVNTAIALLMKERLDERHKIKG